MNLSEDIMFWAFRYTLGRATYSVYDVTTTIIQKAAEISPKTRALMVKEITEAIGNERAGWDCDVQAWTKALNALKAVDA